MTNEITTHENCCHVPTEVCPCPVCGNPGRKVTAMTLDHHLPPDIRPQFGESATFCPNPTCNVVYCDSEGHVAKKGETVLPVTVKDKGDGVYVCYCFEFTRGDLKKDIAANKETTIPLQIKKGVQEKRCDCVRKNPQGACCIGNVASEIKDIRYGPT